MGYVMTIKTVFPLEYDAEHVYINGQKEKIIKKQAREIIPVYRYNTVYEEGKEKEQIGTQIITGYIFFRHNGRFLRGYFRKSCGKFGITRLSEVRDNGQDAPFIVPKKPKSRRKELQKIKLSHACKPREYQTEYSRENYNTDKEYEEAKRKLGLPEEGNLTKVKDEKLIKLAKRNKKISGYLYSLVERKKEERKTDIPDDKLPTTETQGKGYTDSKGKYRETL